MTAAYFNSGATLGVYFAPTKGASDTVAGGDWVDITSYVIGNLSISRGRGSETDTFSTGSLNLSLLNTDRRFDPEYAAGPYFGNLLPMRPIKVEMVYSATTYTLFRGFIQGWPQSWEASDNLTVVSLVAHDLFKVLALAVLPESRWTYEVGQDQQGANWGWWRLGELDSATIAVDASGNEYDAYYVAGSSTSSLVTYDSDPARAAAVGYSVTSSHPIYAAGLAFTIEAWITCPATMTNPSTFYIWGQGAAGSYIGTLLAPYAALYMANGTGLVFIVNDGGSTDYVFQYAEFPTTSLPFIGTHHVVARWDNGTPSLFFDGVSVGSGTGSLSALSSSWGGTVTFTGVPTVDDGYVIDEVLLYQVALSDARILAHYEAGSTAKAGEVVSARITTALTDSGMTWISTSLDTSDVTVRGADYNGGSLLSYLQMLERTEQGRLFVSGAGTLTFHARWHDAANSTISAAFTDASGSTLPYAEAEHEYDDTRIRNDVTVSRTNGTARRVTDATSIARYGLRSETLDGLAGQSDTETLNIARYRVARYKDPAARIRSLTVLPRANPSGLMPVVGGLEIGQKVTFRRAPQGGTAFTKTLTIEGVSHSIDVGGEWRTTYLTAPADPLSPGLWDSGVWDTAIWGI